MADSRHDEGAVSLPFQGPHRHREDASGADLNVPPLRLRLRPGRFAVELTRDGQVFGRHTEADIRLPLPDVSRRHCRLNYVAGCWQVIDLHSLNGVFVNGEQVLQAPLVEGDLLRIGGFTFSIEMGPRALGSASAQPRP